MCGQLKSQQQVDMPPHCGGLDMLVNSHTTKPHQDISCACMHPFSSLTPAILLCKHTCTAAACQHPLLS